MLLRLRLGLGPPAVDRQHLGVVGATVASPPADSLPQDLTDADLANRLAEYG